VSERSAKKGGLTALVATYGAYGGFWGAFVVVFSEFLDERSLTAGGVSLYFAGMSVVAITVMTFVAPRLEPLPRNQTITLSLLTHASGNALLVLLPSDYLAFAFLAMGAGTGLIDVFVNAAGQQVESRSGSSVLQWVHAAYGAGGVVLAMATGIALTNGIPHEAPILVATALQVVVAGVAWRSAALSERATRPQGRFALAIFAERPVLIVPAVIVLFSFFIEGSMDVWSVIFLRDTLGSSIIGGAIGFSAFALAITLGRAIGARFFFHLGYTRTILISGLASLVFAAIAVAAPNATVASLAFLGLGFALSPAAPAAFGMAEGAERDAGLAVGAMTAVGYSGFVVGPPIMGWLADNIGLRAAMSAMLVATVGMATGALRMHRRVTNVSPRD
jgi:fucose permease